jgi:hypothetical protein
MVNGFAWIRDAQLLASPNCQHRLGFSIASGCPETQGLKLMKRCPQYAQTHHTTFGVIWRTWYPLVSQTSPPPSFRSILDAATLKSEKTSPRDFKTTLDTQEAAMPKWMTTSLSLCLESRHEDSTPG